MINNLGMVNHAHVYPNGNVAPHIYTHVYHKAIGRKGSNNMTSLIDKTLLHMETLRKNEAGGELTIIFNNCQGQNKNNTVLKLLAYLVEVG